MISDRELLKLAAKAAGIRYTIEDDDYYKTRKFFGLWLVYDCDPGEHARRYWNPLTDDGDAFRLACDLGLRVFPVARTESGAACSAVGAVTGERLSEVADTLPTRAATRRAIVRAAAAIAKATGEQA